MTEKYSDYFCERLDFFIYRSMNISGFTVLGRNMNFAAGGEKKYFISFYKKC